MENVFFIVFTFACLVCPRVFFILGKGVIFLHPALGEHNLGRFIPLHVTKLSNTHPSRLSPVTSLFFPGIHIFGYAGLILRKFAYADGAFLFAAVETSARRSLEIGVSCVTVAITRSINIPRVTLETALDGE